MKVNWSAIYAIVVRHLYNWRRDFDRVVDTFWWASTDVIFWGLTSTYVMSFSEGVDLMIVFVGGIIFWNIVQNSQREINMPLLDEAWNRNLVNLFTTPISLFEFVLATIILGMFKLLMVLILLCFLAYFLYSYNIFLNGIYLLPAIINLVLVGWSVGFFIDGMIFRFGYKIQAFAWAFIFVIYPFSAVLYPVDILPVWARSVSAMLPTSYVFENMRAILFTGTFNVTDIYISFVLNLIYIVLSLIFLKKMFQNALNNGRLIKLN